MRRKKKQKATLTHIFIEVFISKATTTSVLVRWIRQAQHKRTTMCTQILVLTNKYTEHLSNNNKHEGMTCMRMLPYKQSLWTSPEGENKNLPIQERSLD